MVARGTLADDGASGGTSPIVFVSDPTAEAERIARALRAAGVTVVDVPLSMLVARVAVQHPSVVLVDADSHGALDIVARMRELPRGDDIHVFFLAVQGGALSSVEEAFAHEGSALFFRPVDVASLVRDIEALGGVAPLGSPRAHASTPPPSIAIASPRRPSSRPSLPPPSIRSATFSSGGTEPPPVFVGDGERGSAPSLGSLALAPPVSAELQRLLADAEKRVALQHPQTIAAAIAGAESLAALDEVAPSPEQELDAVLPEELLAALDEPLEDDDETEAPPAMRGTVSRSTRERTTDGGPSRTTGASTGGGATPSGTPRAPTSDPGATPAPPVSRRRTAATDAPAEPPPPPPPSEKPRSAKPPPPAGADLAVTSGDPAAIVASAIAGRTSGSLCFAVRGVERRVVLREGDVVTCASGAEEESLIGFLGARGDLPRETVRRLAPKFAPFGRHAGAALVARGYLLQEQMWPTLRAHAEWVLGHLLQSKDARFTLEPQPPGRLAGEPSVFGGSSGAETFVEVVRRILPSSEAVDALGGVASRIVLGPTAHLLEECALRSSERDALREGSGRTVAEILEAGEEPDFASAIYALAKLGVVELLPAAGGAPERRDPVAEDSSALDAEAVRERVRARVQLVEEGDYFAVLGVARHATGYEIRRAFLELRRTFEPARLLSPELADLMDDVQKIVSVLDEAYEILKDSARRERYRRAIEGTPA